MMMRERTLCSFVMLLIGIAVLLSGCTIKKISELDEQQGDEYSTWTKSGKAFDPVAYVDSIWDTKLIPAFKEESCDFETLLAALKKDPETATQEYGLMSKAGGMGVTFKITGSARVVSYDDSSRNGLLLLDTPPYEGTVDAKMQVGPVIRNTAIRDSVSFIRFTEVGNQLQFASLADELNARMKKEAVEPLDLSSIAGKEINYYGAFKLEDDDSLDDVVITPVIIEPTIAGGA
ncbi:DUF2291 domain-containing protein [Sediminispirochaeta smaragdinae]|uniref:Periplasmic lipoprotein n=1 Tax=Sediminispirochaeta smaragdinae (strain DSM 11293 / JCM 15392 / SEBR 4228) TaxID=573413 RepID=E1RA96_SEDSS|nr:DUF2291 domain-containing protein [Sediminispirochaeta smaragdinae]ADK79387.1 periplasmic lipoprotein [Sediminispirochaeta smaragdinae DSM 11293]